MANRIEDRSLDGVLRRGRPRALRWARAPLALLLSGVLLSACTPELVPVAPTKDGNARAERSGIVVQAEVAAAREYVPRSLTPVKISVRNLSPEGVYVALEDIRLVAEGTQRIAIDPVDIEPRPPVPSMGVDPASQFAGGVVTPTSRDLTVPGGAGSAAAATPDTGGAINSTTGIPVYKPGFGFDPKSPAPDFQGYSSYREYARQEIRKDAFDAGFIDSGEAREGYVYFESPPDGVRRVNLEVRLHSGEGSGPGVVVDIPYTTQS